MPAVTAQELHDARNRWATVLIPDGNHQRYHYAQWLMRRRFKSSLFAAAGVVPRVR